MVPVPRPNLPSRSGQSEETSNNKSLHRMTVPASNTAEVEVLEVHAISSTLRFCQQDKPQSVTEASNACVLPREASEGEAREGGEARAGMRIYVVPMSDQRLLLEAVGDALLSDGCPQSG